MTYCIQLRGLDQAAVKEFEIQPHETFLEVAIRAGLNINYGCAGGNCGLCLARLVSGNIKKIIHSDYVMSAEQKHDNCFLTCTHTALSDCVLEVEPTGQNEISIQNLSVRVRAIKRIGEQACILSLQASRKQRLRFFAGQYARLATHESTHSSNCCTGNFFIASCPCDGRILEFHIPREDKAICHYFFEKCVVGERIHLQAPYGKFVFDEDLTRPVILVAVGVGFAAIKSIVEHVTAQESEMPITLYWLAESKGHYLQNLCRSWEDALDQVHIHLVDLPVKETVCDGDQTQLNHAIVSQLEKILEVEKALAQPKTADTDVYFCAPYFTEASVCEVFAQKAPSGWNLIYGPIY